MYRRSADKNEPMKGRKIQCFIVDDEPLARQRLELLLSSFSDLEIVGEFATGSECIEATLKRCPDVIFLDIGLPDQSGMEVVSELLGEMGKLPAVVFATAYDEHAIEAFELNALDYLSKPVTQARLSKTVKRLREMVLHQEEPNEALEHDRKLRELVEGEGRRRQPEYLTRMEIKNRSEIVFVPVEKIRLFQADGNYLEVHTEDTMHLLRMTMARLERELDPENFVRVSRSAMVSVRRIASIEKRGRHDSWVKLETGEKVAATRNLDTLEERLRG